MMMETKVKLNEFLDKINTDLNYAKDGLLKNERLHETKSYVEDGLKELAKGMDERSRLIIEKILPAWRLPPRHGVLVERRQAEEMMSPLKALILDLLSDGVDGGQKIKEQIVIESGKPYDGRRYLRAIFKEATNLIFIRDTYLRPEILDVLTEYLCDNPGLKIQLIMGDNKHLPAFRASLESFRLQYSLWLVEAKYIPKDDQDHPRYILIDDAIIFNPDHSLDRWGKETVNVHQMVDVGSISIIKKKLETEWAGGVKIL